MVPPMRGEYTRAAKEPLVPAGVAPRPPDTRRYPGVDLLFRALGILVPLAFGVVLPDLSIVTPTANPLLMFSTLLAIGVVGGSLFRMRRGVVVVPLAVFVGLGLAHALLGWFSANFTIGELVGVVPMVVLLWCLPLVVGAACGLPLGIWLEERLPRRGGGHDAGRTP